MMYYAQSPFKSGRNRMLSKYVERIPTSTVPRLMMPVTYQVDRGVSIVGRPRPTLRWLKFPLFSDPWAPHVQFCSVLLFLTTYDSSSGGHITTTRPTPKPPSRGASCNAPTPNRPSMFSALANPRQAAAQVMNFALILSTAFMVCHPSRSVPRNGRVAWRGRYR